MELPKPLGGPRDVVLLPPDALPGAGQRHTRDDHRELRGAKLGSDVRHLSVSPWISMGTLPTDNGSSPFLVPVPLIYHWFAFIVYSDSRRFYV